MFIAGVQVDQLKQARGSASRSPAKLFFTWLFFCTSNTFFFGSSLIFLAGTSEVFVGNVALSAPVLFIVSWESSTLPVSSIVPYCAVTPKPGALLLATSRLAVSINFRLVCYTTGSSRVSLGSGIVFLPIEPQSFYLVREALGAPSATAHERPSLLVSLSLLLFSTPAAPIALYILCILLR